MSVARTIVRAWMRVVGRMAAIGYAWIGVSIFNMKPLLTTRATDTGTRDACGPVGEGSRLRIATFFRTWLGIVYALLSPFRAFCKKSVNALVELAGSLATS